MHFRDAYRVHKYCITQGAQINGYSWHKSCSVFRVNEEKSVDRRTIELVAQKLGILSNRLKSREMLMLDVPSRYYTLGHCGLTTSRVLNTSLIRLATTDGSSAFPITAICSSWRVFTGSQAIPLM